MSRPRDADRRGRPAAASTPPSGAAPTDPCPCGSGARLADCCGRYLDPAGALHAAAPSPEALMRSRYVAYVLGRSDYLLATWHPDTRPAALDPDPPGWRWLGLEVRRSGVDADDPKRGTVEFVARGKLAGRARRLHEVSRFERGADGRWRYVDGRFPGDTDAGPASAGR